MSNATLPDPALLGPLDPAGFPAFGDWEERHDYFSRHWRVKRWRGKAKRHNCTSCADDGIRKRARDWAQIHGETGEDPWADYLTLCRSCHMRYDKSGHRVPHTAAARAKMSEACTLAYAEGRRIGQNTFQSGKTRCRNGHEYSDENTYINPKTGERVCRTCRYDNLMRWKAGQKAKVAADRLADPELAVKAKANSAGKGSKRTGQALENIRLGSQRRRQREQAEREAAAGEA